MSVRTVLSIASEAFPLVKTGGLGDVVGALPIALTREGLLRVDVLLHRFFKPEHTGIRYT